MTPLFSGYPFQGKEDTQLIVAVLTKVLIFLNPRFGQKCHGHPRGLRKDAVYRPRHSRGGFFHDPEGSVTF